MMRVFGPGFRKKAFCSEEKKQKTFAAALRGFSGQVPHLRTLGMSDSGCNFFPI
jgi:hypothetical protein